MISNLGEAVVHIRQISINGSLDFSPLVDNRDVRIDEGLLDDPDKDGRPGLAPFNPDNPTIGQFIVQVEYAPPEEGPDRGSLVILSDDPNSPELIVDLSANGETPCLTVTPRALEFETSLVNRTDSRPLSIESCGGTQLTISDIYIADSSDPAFGVVEESLPAMPSVLPALTPGELPPARQIQVSFSPREQHIYNGTLIIESDDPVTPKREVSLLGRGVQNACPRAAATQDEFFVNPLDPVILDGSASVDPDGPGNVPERYEWVVTARPMGSTSQPIENFIDPLQPQDGGPDDDVYTPTAMFFTDLAGTYTIELRVTDNLGAGAAACTSAIAVVTIIAKPDEAIHVQLVWDTPMDVNQTDEDGTDLDLHFLHPRANNWFDPGLDCYFRDYEPDWGQQGNPNDNPTLDIDDFNGAGPENVSLAQPEIILDEFDEALPYTIGVHYNKSVARTTGEEFGASHASVRVFLNGEIAWDSQEALGGLKELEREGHFWEAAQIFWPGDPEAAYVETRDRYFESPPGL
ncbi:hypothetical protein KKF91_01555 [Myxococcota bacterium]|nr:hypothetical protein [Myxococcota bacterium]MBU1429223.1 hypothetical protein [Myxococcota bacterium]MBU1899176.1 hypothetical protein [Myxococcota bacterium]